MVGSFCSLYAYFEYSTFLGITNAAKDWHAIPAMINPFVVA